MDIQDKLADLHDKLSNQELREDLVKISQDLNQRSGRTTFLVDIEEIESLVNSEIVTYEDDIGNVSIDK